MTPRRRIWTLLLLALAALLASGAEASRTGVWERNPPAALTATTTDAASLLASLTPAASADVEPTETPRFDLGDVVLVDAERDGEERFGLGPLQLLGPAPLRGPPPSYPETRVGGFELLPPFRVGASPTLSLWSRHACGFSCREVVSDSRYDPWGLQSLGQQVAEYNRSRNDTLAALDQLKVASGATADLLDLATDLGPGIGQIKLASVVLHEWNRGNRRPAYLVFGTVAGGAAVSILARRMARLEQVGTKAVNEVDEATLAAERKAAGWANEQAEEAARVRLSQRLQDAGEGGLVSVPGGGAAGTTLVGTQNPSTAWAAKTGRAYDRRVTRLWRQYEGQNVGGWTVEAVNRRLGPGVQPDLVLVNESLKTIVIHDATSKAAGSHLAKGARYKKFFEKERPGYEVEYSEGYWEGMENAWEALSRKGQLYFPGQTKPPTIR